jgi:hypothetical protein
MASDYLSLKKAIVVARDERMSRWLFRAGRDPVRLEAEHRKPGLTARSRPVVGWRYGLHDQGASYTVASAAVNLSIVLFLSRWWLAIQRLAPTASALGHAIVLHRRLFWLAFPYLGDLP